MNYTRITGADPIPGAGSAYKTPHAPKRIEAMDAARGIRSGKHNAEEEEPEAEESAETEGMLDERAVFWDAHESSVVESEYWRESFPLEDDKWGSLLGNHLRQRRCAPPMPDLF